MPRGSDRSCHQLRISATGTAFIAALLTTSNVLAQVYTQEDLEWCAAQIDSVKKLEAQAFDLAEEKAVAVDQAKKWLRLCLANAAACGAKEVPLQGGQC
jgi:hypothetical protein